MVSCSFDRSCQDWAELLRIRRGNGIGRLRHYGKRQGHRQGALPKVLIWLVRSCGRVPFLPIRFCFWRTGLANEHVIYPIPIVVLYNQCWFLHHWAMRFFSREIFCFTLWFFEMSSLKMSERWLMICTVKSSERCAIFFFASTEGVGAWVAL